jgi:hypothetical protein
VIAFAYPTTVYRLDQTMGKQETVTVCARASDHDGAFDPGRTVIELREAIRALQNGDSASAEKNISLALLDVARLHKRGHA